MALFKSGNPTLKESTFEGFGAIEDAGDQMTLHGTINKVGILLVALLIPALYVWQRFSVSYEFDSVSTYFFAGLIGGLALGLTITFKKELAPYISIPYAICQGLVLGGLSAIMEFRYPGIVIQALLLTVGIFIALLFIYKLEIIKPSENFKLIVASATGGIALYYIISLALGFFNINAPLINDSSLLGIGFSFFVVVVASMNLVVDFDFIEQGVKNKVPRYMEWYGAFGLMVTLIWLYIEILRLLGKARRR